MTSTPGNRAGQGKILAIAPENPRVDLIVRLHRGRRALMCQHHDQIHLGSQARDQMCKRRYGITHLHAGDVRGDERSCSVCAEQAYDAKADTAPLDDRPGLGIGVVGASVEKIRAKDREGRASFLFGKAFPAVLEFVIADCHGVVVQQLHQVERDGAVAATRQTAGEDVTRIEQESDLGRGALLLDERRQLPDSANARHIAAPERVRRVVGAFEIVCEQQRDGTSLCAPQESAAEKPQRENCGAAHGVRQIWCRAWRALTTHGESRASPLGRPMIGENNALR